MVRWENPVQTPCSFGLSEGLGAFAFLVTQNFERRRIAYSVAYINRLIVGRNIDRKAIRLFVFRKYIVSHTSYPSLNSSAKGIWRIFFDEWILCLRKKKGLYLMSCKKWGVSEKVLDISFIEGKVLRHTFSTAVFHIKTGEKKTNKIKKVFFSYVSEKQKQSSRTGLAIE